MSTPFDQPSTLAGGNDPEGGDGAYSFDGKPDRWKRYRLPHPETGKASGFTRATTFAKSISDTFALSMWGLRKGGLGLVARPDLLMRLASTAPDDKETQNNIMEEAKNAAGTKVGANLGTALHAFSEAVDRGEEPNIPPPYQPHMKAYTALLQRFNLEILDIERVVLCTEYDGGPANGRGVAGTLDRIARFTKDTTVTLPGGKSYTFTKGTIVILDLKTGKDLQYGWLEIAVQLATYARSKVRFDKEKKVWLDMPEGMDLNVALVVHLPATAMGDKVKAEMYAVDIGAGHEIAALCTQVREARKRKDLSTLLAVVEELPAPPIPGEKWEEAISPGPDSIKVTAQRADVPGTDVRPPTLMERVQTARTEDDLTAIWWEAVKARQDGKTLADAIRARKQSLLADSAAG